MNKITKVTRKGILLDLIGIKSIDIEKIILTFFDAKNLKSYDSRYQSMIGDHFQHRENNHDWEDDWFIEDDRLNFYGITDEKFLEFVSFIIHPENITDSEIIKGFLKSFNDKLIRDGFEIKYSGEKVSGFDIFKGFQIFGGKKRIQFYTNAYKGIKKYPYVLLMYNNWDDFGWRTTFSVTFFSESREEIYLSRVKILSNKSGDNTLTILPTSFKELGDEYCSIFSTDEGFKNLDSKEIRDYKKTILESLNEVTYNTNILAKFKNVSGFSSSLLRDSEAYARVQNIENSLLSFGFKNNNGDIFFNFEKSELPFRINVLIGKNGSGKTTLLSKIANEIVEYKGEEKSLLTIRPSFLKIIQVSYSVFDNFTIPSEKKDFKYIYCGLRNNEGKIDMLSLQKRLSISLTIIEKKGKNSIFTYLLRDLLDEDTMEFNNILETYIKYSSGQKILITILSEIISNIEENSLILFDEPETHLHPNMIFKLVKVMYSLLDDNNSYLIIATHSPIVLQQIPSKSVQIIDNFGNRNLSIESFGDNFSEITKEVFGNYEEEDVLYKEIFRKLVEKYFSEDEILEMFNNGLSLNSRIYLKTLFNLKKKNEENK